MAFKRFDLAYLQHIAAKHALIKTGAKNLVKGNAPMAIATTRRRLPK